jgi:SpoVK/Ycf46/Vps4 family AAA+-type ATPase
MDPRCFYGRCEHAHYARFLHREHVRRVDTARTKRHRKLARKRVRRAQKAARSTLVTKRRAAADIVAGIESFADIAALDGDLLDTSVPRLAQLKRLIPSSKRVDAFVGMSETKDRLYKLVIGELFHALVPSTTPRMRNIVLTGDPGVGKTMLAAAIAELFVAAGGLTDGKVVYAGRADLVGKYLGSTAPKTKALVESAKGGVLFIDEAYAMGGSDQKDYFALEAINQLNVSMSENPDVLVIIAGYADAIEQSFMKQNAGLARRFPVRLTMSAYSGDELARIFVQMASADDWTLEEGVVNLVSASHKQLLHQAGDCTSLLLYATSNASIRLWKTVVDTGPRLVTIEDVNAALTQLTTGRTPAAEGVCHTLSMYS